MTKMKTTFKLKVLLSVLALSLFASCGKDMPAGKVKVGESHIIVGEVDWKEVTELSTTDAKRVSSRAIADIQFADGNRCTGFLISDNVLMTNEHCIVRASDIEGMKVFMKHEKGVAKSAWAEIKCSKFLGNDVELDVALVECDGRPGQEFGKVELEEYTPQVGEQIYVVHQNCDYYTDRDCDWSKKLSMGVVTTGTGDIYYDADTLGGSSGSPVFRGQSNKVIAIHHFGHGGSWWSNGRGTSNSGVPMTKVVPYIKANFPQVLVASAPPTAPGPVFSDDNQTYTTATFLSASVSAQDLAISSSSDVDMYKVEMKAGEVLDFKIKFSHAEGDIDFKIYKEYASGKRLVKTVESSSDDESIKLRVSSSTPYYIKVYGYKGAMAKYDLEFKK